MGIGLAKLTEFKTSVNAPKQAMLIVKSAASEYVKLLEEGIDPKCIQSSVSRIGPKHAGNCNEVEALVFIRSNVNGRAPSRDTPMKGGENLACVILCEGELLPSRKRSGMTMNKSKRAPQTIGDGTPTWGRHLDTGADPTFAGSETDARGSM